MTHVAWSCDGKKLAAVGIDKTTRIWVPEKSVRLGSLSMALCSITNASNDCRWSQEVRHHSQVDTATMLTTSLGIQHILSFSVRRVRRTGGLSSGTPDVSRFAIQFLEYFVFIFFQKVDTLSNVR